MAIITFFAAPLIQIILVRLSLTAKIKLSVSTGNNIACGVAFIMAITAQCTSAPLKDNTCVPLPFVDFFAVAFLNFIMVIFIGIVAIVTEQKKQKALKTA